MFEANLKYQKTITMVTEICCNCGVAFGMPSDLQDVFQNNPDKSFYCPNGHRQHYSWSKEAKARQEAERKLSQAEQQLRNAEFEKIQLEGKIKKQGRDLKRLTNGVCPCCNRTFSNLHNHMKKQHPDHIIK